MTLDYNDHAVKCGINMTGKIAVPLDDSNGHLIMVDLIDPETRDAVTHAGTTMDVQLIEVCKSYGIDYVIVYNGSHRSRYI